VLICSVPPAAATEIEKLFVAVCWGELESFAWIVKFERPLVVGVPVICPDVDKLSPAGRDPDCKVHVYGATPPLAAMVVL
jgi:hypothetical protein